MTEEEWWNQYGEINKSIWNYDEYLQPLVRGPYLQEMFTFLFQPGGKLLDFGCGTGWVSLPFAQQGMWVEGIDSAPEQVERAWKEAQRLQLNNVNYAVGGLEQIGQHGPYSAAVVHSLIHHLPAQQQAEILVKIAQALETGGRIFLYEPMAAISNRPLHGILLDKSMGAIFRFLRWLALLLNLYRPEIAQLERQGWKMVSPDEAPLLPDYLLSLIPPELRIIKFDYWHAYAVNYANFCMGLKAQPRYYFRKFIPLFIGFDRLFLVSRWRKYLRAWPMAVCLLEKYTP